MPSDSEGGARHKILQSSRPERDNEGRKRLNSKIHPISQPSPTTSPRVRCHPAGFSEEQMVRVAMLRFRGSQRYPKAGSKVVVSRANSPSDFYVWLQDDTTKFELRFVSHFLDQYFKYDFRSYWPSRVGWVVGARYRSNWYRAIVMEILHDSQCKVLFVDFGNTEVVAADKLRRVPGRVLSGLPAWQAVNCRIVGQFRREANQAWNAQDMSWFFENCRDKSFTVLSAVYPQETELGVELDLAFAQPVDGFKTVSEMLMSRKFGRAKVTSDSCLIETVYPRTSSVIIPEELVDGMTMISLQKAPNEAESVRHNDLGTIWINAEWGRCRLKDLPAQRMIGDFIVAVLLIDHPGSFWCQDLVQRKL